MAKVLIEELPNGALDSGKLYFTDDTPIVRTKQTNADRIRAMSDEELAEFLSRFYECECCEHNNYELCKKCEFEGGGDGILKWLKSEVKE